MLLWCVKRCERRYCALTRIESVIMVQRYTSTGLTVAPVHDLRRLLPPEKARPDQNRAAYLSVTAIATPRRRACDLLAPGCAAGPFSFMSHLISGFVLRGVYISSSFI